MSFPMGYYTQHLKEGAEESDPTMFEKMTRNTFASVVNKAALSNSDVQAEALSKADSYSFQVAHPEFMRTTKNTKLVNHWLSSQHITNPTYPDFEAATEALTAEGLLDIDKAEFARHQDQRGNRTFTGTLTGQQFDSLGEMIAFERQAALRKVSEATKEEQAFENLPIDVVRTMLRQAERSEQLEANGLQTGKNGTAWITLHPEYVDSDRNAHLMKMQLATNGVSDNNATIQDYEIAGNQLRESGLLTLNKAALAKQHAAEVGRLASEAVKTPGTVFDNTSEDEMYNLDLDEVRRRANAVMGRR